MAGPERFWTGWRDRISALRNVPAVLKIVWDSGPAVVIFGLVSRLVSSILPVVLLWITQLIVDGIVHAVSTHQHVQRGPGARGGQPAEIDGEEQDQHQADPERGQG